MNVLSDILKACVVCIAALCQLSTQDVVCPQHPGSDPNDVNARIQKLAGQKTYVQEDSEYRYRVTICQQTSGAGDNVAIQQFGKNWDDKRKWITVGRYDHATVTGGTDWLMITYPDGDKYNTHCKQLSRQGVLTITCDPGVEKGEIKIIEEFRTNATESKTKPTECYYLFELNNDAACTVKPKHLSPGSILLIILAVVGTVFILLGLLGFLYQRYVVGAKGLEQIPNYSFWTDCRSLQADGCNFICRCTEAQTTRYKTMDDILADDDKDDTLLPM